MNRIYQGRVSKVLDDQNRELDLNVLWQHHELFQDAVNYYLVCLLSLANDQHNDMGKLREQITKDGSDGFVWGAFRKRGVTRRGLRDSVAPYLTPQNNIPSFNEVVTAVLAGNSMAATDEGKATLEDGLRQLLSKCTGASGCRNAAPEFLPRFCKPNGNFTFEEDPSRLIRDAQRPKLIRTLHNPATQYKSASLEEFGPQSIALIREGCEVKGSKLQAKLHEFLDDWKEKYPEPAADWTRLEQSIKELPAEISAPDYAGTSAKGNDRFLLAAMFFFQKLEKSPFTFGLMKMACRPPKATSESADESVALVTVSVGDPIRLARGTRGYVFRAFTSLPCWGGDDSGEIKWEKFDVAAFEEALKALHQVDEKGKERAKELARKQARHDYQRGKSKKWKSDGSTDEESRPPILAGDERIARLEQLVDVDLRAEYEMSEGVEVKYGLQQRTIRGFRDLQKIWSKEVGQAEDYSDATRERLADKLREYQKDNPQIVGSVRLFAALLEKQNWIIWREPTAAQLDEWRKKAKFPDDTEFASDPLQALTDERELKEELKRLAEPIRLTPADPEHSRRQFYFSDAAKFTERGEYRHEPNKRIVSVPLAKREGGIWQLTRVLLHYSAPRLLRENLRADEGEKLGAMPWLQPMMAALGFPAPVASARLATQTNDTGRAARPRRWRATRPTFRQTVPPAKNRKHQCQAPGTLKPPAPSIAPRRNNKSPAPAGLEFCATPPLSQ